jgi:YHS domain-containing protein
MLRLLFTRFILPLLVFWVLRYIFKSIGDSLKTSASPQRYPQAAAPPTGGELRKDPVCGTYVSSDTAVTRTVKGELLHFCSATCRDKYAG